MSATIVLLTRPNDPTADRLEQELARRSASVLRFDTKDFPQLSVLDAFLTEDFRWRGTLSSPQGAVKLEGIGAIWYFHPRHHHVDERLPEPYQDLADGETRYSFGGVLRALDCFWVSYPDAVVEATYKPLQLTLARTLGFKTPRTLITNGHNAALRFYEQCNGQMVKKAQYTGFVPLGGDDFQSLYTRVVTPDDLADAQNIRYAPTLFQELIPKQIELRITVIGTRILTVAIHSQHSERSRIDWRAGYEDLRYSIFDLPEDISQKCVHLVHDLHLNYGCIDMIITPKGEYIFLEINSIGQYLWLEQKTKLPFTEMLADLLIGGSNGAC